MAGCVAASAWYADIGNRNAWARSGLAAASCWPAASEAPASEVRSPQTAARGHKTKYSFVNG
jgi:hypothetical protein